MNKRLEFRAGHGRASSAVAIALVAAFAGIATPPRAGGEPSAPAASGLVTLAPRAGADGLAPAPFTAELGPGGVSVRLPDSGVAWSWRLLAVEVGAEPVSGVEPGPVQPVATGAGVVDYRRGAVVERYVARESSVEQQFVIPEPLQPAGEDLVITGRVEGGGRFRAAAGGWQWGEGRRAVRLGDVTVFDARGRELPARLEVSATETRLRVGADGLAAAAYPVTVDPEIGVNDFRISDMGPEGSPLYSTAWVRVAHNPIRDEYLVVWDGNDVMADGDEIYGQRLDGSGAELGENDFRISDMGPPSDARLQADVPTVAYNSVDDEYLVVWEGDDEVDGELEIYGQRIDGATGAELGENDFRISTMGPDGDTSFDAYDPAVAYNPIEDEYLVVWSGEDAVNGELEIYGQRIDGATGAELGEDDFRISDMGPDGDVSSQAHEPAVVYNPNAHEYLVIWQGNEVAATEFEVYVQRLDATTSAELGTNDLQVTDVFDDADHPEVAYNPNDDNYLVVFNTRKFFLDTEQQIYGQLLDGTTAAEIGRDDFRISDMGPDGGGDSVDGFRPDIAYSTADGEYLVVWNGIDEPAVPGNGEAEVWGQRLDGATGEEVGANDFRLSDMGPDGDTNFDAAQPKLAYRPGANEFLVVWDGDDLVNGEGEVWGQRYAPGLFEDDFEDEEIAADWSLPRGTWSEELGVLAGVPAAEGLPAGAVAAGFEGCSVCTVTADLAARNLTGPPEGSLVWLMAFAEGLPTNVLVALRPELDRVLFAQRDGGRILAGASAAAAIEPGVSYRVEIRSDGARFVVSLDGEVLFDEPSAFPGEPLGTVGFGARGAEVEVAGVFVVEGAVGSRP